MLSIELLKRQILVRYLIEFYLKFEPMLGNIIANEVIGTENFVYIIENAI